MLAVSDICLIVENLPAAIVFYKDVLGFDLRRHAPGFADFSNRGSTLALWERSHLVEHVGIACPPSTGAPGTSMAAIEVASPEDLDRHHREMTGRGVTFLAPPRWYAWNAYACYFEDPEHHLWELYTWGPEGHAGLFELPA